ncbi:MAG: hypothetical protein FJ388_11935 [Verrucomicrobia bacterium]|nr:hypothetical protein [Verrucomicrobiota bacterium]
METRTEQAHSSASPRPSQRAFGEQERSIDRKNRLIIPPDYRPSAGTNELILIRRPGEYLVALTPEQYDKVHAISLEKIPDLAERRNFTTLMSHAARKVQIDKQARVTLTPQEVEHVGATDNRSVVIKTGSELSLFEVWGAKQHRDSVAALMGDQGKAMLSKIGI